MTRYANPALDALLDRMQSMQPSPTDAGCLDLVTEALKIYLDDVPQVVFAEEFHTLVFNTTYWTGWPSAENPADNAGIHLGPGEPVAAIRGGLGADWPRQR